MPTRLQIGPLRLRPPCRDIQHPTRNRPSGSTIFREPDVATSSTAMYSRQPMIEEREDEGAIGAEEATSTAQVDIQPQEPIWRPPEHSLFLRAWEEYMVTVTDAPLDFIHAAGLGALSTTALGWRKLARGSRGLRPNLYLMLLAGSSRDRKSTCVDEAHELLLKIYKKRVGPSDFTGQGLAKWLKAAGVKRPTCILPISEFGNYLAASNKQVNSDLGTMLCQLYDGTAVIRARSMDGVSSISEARVTLLGAVAFGMLAAHGRPEEWTTGFYARMLWITPGQRRERFIQQPKPDERKHQHAIAALKSLKMRLSARQLTVDVTPEGNEVYAKFDTEIPADLKDPAKSAQRERLMTQVLKLALLYQIDSNPNVNISGESMDAAVCLARRSWASFETAYAVSSGTVLTRMAKSMWMVLSRHVERRQEKCMRRRELFKHVHGNLESLLPALKVMVELGVARTQTMRTSKGQITEVVHLLEPYSYDS